MMKNCAVFHNGKPQSGTSRLSGMALVHPVKALENSLLFAFRNANSVIFHAEVWFSVQFPHKDFNFSPFRCITDGIVCDILKHLIQNMSNSLYLSSSALILQIDFFLRCPVLKIIDHIFTKFSDVNRFKHGFPVFLIQT